MSARTMIIDGRPMRPASPVGEDRHLSSRKNCFCPAVIWTTRFSRTNLVGLAIDYLTFCVSAAWTLGRLARSGDVIIAKTDPPNVRAFSL